MSSSVIVCIFNPVEVHLSWDDGYYVWENFAFLSGSSIILRKMLFLDFGHLCKSISFEGIFLCHSWSLLWSTAVQSSRNLLKVHLLTIFSKVTLCRLKLLTRIQDTCHGYSLRPVRIAKPEAPLFGVQWNWDQFNNTYSKPLEQIEASRCFWGNILFRNSDYRPK